MIYIEDITTPRDVYFPRTLDAEPFLSGAGEIPATLALRNTTTHEERTVQLDVTPEGEYLVASNFSLPATPSTDPGEWEFALLAETVVLSSGIMKIGPRAQAPDQYETPDRNEQYVQ